jgi:glycosyltransferase involved in cell wall biosynthesis
MNILFISPSPDDWRNGIFFHRIHQASIALSKRGHAVKIATIGGTTSEQIINWCDVVIFGRTYHPATQPIGLVKQFKSKGKRIIWDFDDDFWQVQKDNPSALVSNAYKDQYEDFIREADALITPSKVLATKAKRLVKGKPVMIAPNGVDLDTYIERPHAHQELIIGWAGAASHWKDLQLITKPIIALQKKYEFAFVLYGITGQPIESEMFEYNEMLQRNAMPEKNEFFKAALKWWEEMKELKFYPHIPAHVPFYTPFLHPHKLSNLDFDIGIAPLEDTEFNHGKSCIKFYEYAATGATVLTSDVLPYKDEVTYRAKNTEQDWYNKLEKLIVDADFRKKLGKEQQDWVKKYRSLDAIALDWELALQKPGGLEVLNQQR